MKEAHEKTTVGSPGAGGTRRFASVRVFLLCLSLLYFSKAFAGSYMKSSITSIERRFDLPSSVAGMIDGGFEFGNLLVMAFVSFFGARFHRPRIIAVGATLMGLSTLLMAMPHFFMGRYSYQSIVSGNSSHVRAVCALEHEGGGEGKLLPPELLSVTLAGEETTRPAPAGCDSASSSYLWVIVLIGNALRGVGEAPIGPLGISFFDDHVREENTAFYLGCVNTVGLLGPAFGFMLGAFCARVFVDIGFINMADVAISPRDARWVGAWWLGFLISGTVVLATAIPFWFFPRSMAREGEPEPPATGSSKELADAEPLWGPPKGDTQAPESVDVKAMAKELGPAMRTLLGNRVYVCMMVTAVMNVNAMVGFYTFKAKYIEQQFGETASKANFMIGAVNIPVVALGIFVGGMISKKLKLTLMGFSIMSLLTDLPAYLIVFSYFVFGCSEAQVVGLTVDNSGVPMATRSLLGESLVEPCNAACPCPPGEWDPVCGVNNLTYVSPCLAGCATMSGSGKATAFEQCACVGGAAWGNASAVLGQCPRGSECPTAFLQFMVASVLASLVGSMGFTASQLIFLRCIPKTLKAFAIGIQMLVIRTLAGIPAPIFFGAAIDSTCLKWTSSGCSGQGSCRLYDIKSYRYTVVSVMLGFRTTAVALAVLVVFNVRRQLRREAADARGAEKGAAGGHAELLTVARSDGDPCPAETGDDPRLREPQKLLLLPEADPHRETVV
uniref:Solute carrier organic anion transporter family member n=1 Tax=Petromyzon marinus TaxID=7757 RepID=A0AAJ7X010_PETMA|nr:solute carrier organic anion transporter family member 1C1-like [Petromyzon marinus]